MDRRRSPFLALWTGDSLAVQRHGDCARRLPGEVVLENTAYNICLYFVDFPFAADRFSIGVELLDDIIPEAQAAARLAFLDTAAQAASRLVG